MTMTQTTETVWLIEELWTDMMENQRALAIGYKAIGAAMSSEDAKLLVIAGGHQIGDGWPIANGKVMARRRATVLKILKPNVEAKPTAKAAGRSGSD